MRTSQLGRAITRFTHRTPATLAWERNIDRMLDAEAKTLRAAVVARLLKMSKRAGVK